MVHYPLMLTHWLSLWYTLISYWPTAPTNCTQLSSTGPLAPTCALVHYYRHWPTGYLCGTLPSSSCPLAISMVHFYLLLAHWLSLWYTTIFYWPTGYLYGTPLFSSGVLAISMVHYYFLFAHWLSLSYTIIFN